MKNNLAQLTVAVLVVVLAAAVLNPLHVWMPTMLAMALLAALFVLFCVFAVFVLREQAADERDEHYRALAGRAAFLVGAGVLVVAIVAGDLAHTLDPWLVVALAAMIVTKLLVRAGGDWGL